MAQVISNSIHEPCIKGPESISNSSNRSMNSAALSSWFIGQKMNMDPYGRIPLVADGEGLPMLN